jgi:hypothetical protein
MRKRNAKGSSVTTSLEYGHSLLENTEQRRTELS